MTRKIFILVCLLALCRSYAAAAATSALVWPPPPDQARIEFVRSLVNPADMGVKKSLLKKLWDFLAGAEETEFLRPFALAAGNKRLFITDTGMQSFHLLDFGEGKYWQASDKKISLQVPVGVALGKNGKALIADSGLKKVLVFDEHGDFEGAFAPGFAFQRPTAVSVSPLDGTVWVVDTLSHQVVKFSPAGERLFTVGRRGVKQGEFNFPAGITVAGDGRVFVCDTLNARIQIFSAQGKFLSAFGRHGDATGDFSYPKAIALDSDGNIYVVDGLFDAVQIFDQKGRLLLVLGFRGSREGEFSVPSAIAVDETDTIYVADSYNKRIQVFRYLKEAKR